MLGSLMMLASGSQRLLAQFGQRVGHALLRRQVLGEIAQDAGRDRDVALLDAMPAGLVKARTIGRKAWVASSGASSVSV